MKEVSGYKDININKETLDSEIENVMHDFNLKTNIDIEI